VRILAWPGLDQPILIGVSTNIRSSDRTASAAGSRLTVVLGVLSVVLAALSTHFVIFVIASLNCTGFGDSPPGPPALSSPQGRLCGHDASLVGSVIWCGGFVLSLILTIALILLAWRRWSWRLGLPALTLLVVLPLATARLLNLPSNECSPEVLASQPQSNCTYGN
jgi:hypothetical protein